MHDYADKAASLYEQGYNCAQAVYGAFAEQYGMDFDDAMKVSSALGGGLGHSGEVCGAVLGMALALGQAKGYKTPDAQAKMAMSTETKALVDAFRAAYGETSCDALREVGNRALCTGYVRYAAKLVQDAIEGQG